MRMNPVPIYVVGSLLMCVSVLAEKVTLLDGRELEGAVIKKGTTVTVITKDNKLFQFNTSQLKAVPEKGADADTAKQAAPAKAKAEAKAGAPAAAVKQAGPTITEGNPIVKIKTSQGDMLVELFEDKVPNTVANMISLAEKGFYKGMRFHRVVPGFMAQGGCPNSKKGATGRPGTGDPGYRFKDEFHKDLKHNVGGILSMANSGKNTNGSQFFICFRPTPFLDNKHAVFGKVTDGMDILAKIEALGTPDGPPTRGWPKEDVDFDIEVVSKRAHPYDVKKL